ncbi:hypothetical protein [Leptolyngbya sp. 7M]|uniref:hypothetical protein n=1 Tax=Leptolyngbya sp. 7M TaxID=2812896 RepID=UPI001B8D9FBE|nr:hypothetical protein [Leptolyngbya sp. 7M]QYO64723.1 hypothetical protein JVX88_34855 [Leptolyngbya sp. 7M]
MPVLPCPEVLELMRERLSASSPVWISTLPPLPLASGVSTAVEIALLFRETVLARCIAMLPALPVPAVDAEIRELLRESAGVVRRICRELPVAPGLTVLVMLLLPPNVICLFALTLMLPVSPSLDVLEVIVERLFNDKSLVSR